MPTVTEARNYVSSLYNLHALSKAMIDESGDPEAFIDAAADYISTKGIALSFDQVVDTLVYLRQSFTPPA